ncbi:lipocalin family protein [Flavobacterium sp.]|uniref:lipocalin family protein n=1 Tax=Flavobacterium sp. TaxID=239 RepID=UPI002B4AEA2B|nr:lipocalin family protein [Flavobacterium sp.]HLP64941.1 lipocalin family protein [Flavobacterium sp.]
MKKTIFMMATAASLVFASCKGNAESTEGETTQTTETTTVAEEPVAEEPASIVGEWKMTDFNVDMEIPKGQEKAIEDMKKKVIESTTYTFKEDGTMSFKNNLVKEAGGTYTYADGKITFIDNRTKKEEVLTVDELTANKLVFSVEQAGRKASMSFAK